MVPKCWGGGGGGGVPTPYLVKHLVVRVTALTRDESEKKWSLKMNTTHCGGTLQSNKLTIANNTPHKLQQEALCACDVCLNKEDGAHLNIEKMVVKLPEILLEIFTQKLQGNFTNNYKGMPSNTLNWPKHEFSK